MPQVAVIMSAHNAERFLRPAVQSILEQTFTDFEFVVIDDGSTDRTKEILDEYAASDERLRVISRPRTGYPKALIEGIAASSAPLIARMDADDVSMPRRLEWQVRAFEADPKLVLLGGAYEYIDEAGRKIRRWEPAFDHDTLDRDAMERGNPFCHPLVMFRRDVYEQLGGYDPALEPAEDLDLWLRMAERGRVACLPDLLLQYRQHAGSVSQQKQTRQLEMIALARQRAGERRKVAVSTHVEPWRPISDDAEATFKSIMQFGWWAWNSRQRRTALVYGMKALGRRPFSPAAWKLVAACLLRPCPEQPA
jgi:GT2 family glycosyltransferase